ncbi:methyltransferase [Myxococcota bacterium]|nr:methyltransferase [Myxococcota bacterium]
MRDRLRAWAGLLWTRTVEVEGLALRIPPGVLDPVAFRSGAWFARQVAARVRPGQRVLDLGCGSGIVGLLAQRAGARVVAVDLSPAAVAAARGNGLPDVRLGDLFAAVQGERFDLVACNPPYLQGPPRGRLPRTRSLSRALYGGPDWEVARRFARQVPDHLAPGGEALLCWSDRAGQEPRPLLVGAWAEQATLQLPDERLSLHVLAAATAGDNA